jgi:hypothetical protein
MTNFKLEPSRYFLCGFLGNDKRPLSVIVAADRKSLAALKVAVIKLASALKRAQSKARNAFGAEVEIIKGLHAAEEGARGTIPCPLCGKGYEKGETVLTRENDGRKLTITPLSLHLIEKHGFFQGKGSLYRMDPAIIVEFLGLAKKKERQ